MKDNQTPAPWWVKFIAITSPFILIGSLMAYNGYQHWSEDQETKTTEPVVKHSPSVAEVSIEESRRVKSHLERRLQEVANRIKVNGPPSTAEEARILAQIFRDRFSPAEIELTGQNQGRFSKIDGCATSPNCFPFIVTVPRLVDGHEAMASWNGQTMMVHEFLDPQDGFAPFVVFHELVHLIQTMRGTIGREAPPIFADREVPHETEAHRVESAFMNTYTGGKYLQLVKETAADIENGQASYVKSRSCVFTAANVDRVFALFTEGGRELSLASRTALHADFIVDVNLILVGVPRSPEEKRTGAYRFVYANCFVERTDPRVQQLAAQVMAIAP